MTYQGPPQGYNQPQPGGYPPPPPSGPYGAQRGIPNEVNVSSILLFVAGGFSLLGGLLLLALGSIAAIFAVFAVLYLAVGGAEIWTGVALRQLKPWARMAALVLAGLGAALSIVALIKGSFLSVVGLGIDVYILYALTRPNVVAAFPSR